MNLRTTLVLALILAVGIIAVVLIDKNEKQQTVEKNADEKLLSFSEADIDEIALQPSGVRMVRYGDGWRIIEPVETPADMNNVKTLLSMFGWAKKERTIEAGTSELKAYGLDPAYGTLIIHHHGVRDTVFVGDSNVSNSLVYCQVSGSADIFMATLSLRTNIDRTLFEWRDKNLFSIQSTDVRRFILENSNGRFAFRRSGSDWLMQEP
ncbi:DUF4340 domain-containing protein, partial [candidate division KSB1 bacterium]|nr:DUF4340 domain-containing protein [candidate division KSB1 bacterium]